MPAGGDHWEGIYASTAATDLSWYEPEPAASLRLIEELAPGPSRAVIDVGAGESLLVDSLLARGFTDVTVLDVSRHALDEVEERLGGRASGVNLVCSDVLQWTPDGRYDIWHDRAVFHFLTDPIERDQYVELAERAVRDDGALVVGTFAEDGPTHCSGLPVVGYSPRGLAEVFSASFDLVTHEREEHTTPGGAMQPFTWVVLRRTRHAASREHAP
jgi:2-polyprenyl-3-methyl-5-hydroxy-6-metoxy-1,4-benzoquinol methylase